MLGCSPQQGEAELGLEPRLMAPEPVVLSTRHGPALWKQLLSEWSFRRLVLSVTLSAASVLVFLHTWALRGANIHFLLSVSLSWSHGGGRGTKHSQ